VVSNTGSNVEVKPKSSFRSSVYGKNWDSTLREEKEEIYRINSI
jgi:hypothetical protein